MGRSFLVALVASTCFASAASAGTLVVDGTTAGGPTWNRPIEDGLGPPGVLSSTGTNVSYDVVGFAVSVSGNYDFLSVTGGWDNYTFLYGGAFDPSNPFANILIGNDDFSTIGRSGFTYALTAGTNYRFVTTGFSNSDQGQYRLTINGIGAIVRGNVGAVPEPGTWALMLLGFGAVGVAMRRQRRPEGAPALA